MTAETSACSRPFSTALVRTSVLRVKSALFSVWMTTVWCAVLWLSRAGVRAFQVGPQVRTGGSFAADVDPSLVRGWRILLDSEHVRRAS